MKQNTLWLSAQNLNDFGPCPEYAMWKPSPEDVVKLKEMFDLTGEHDLSELRYYGLPDRWGPSSEESPSFDAHAPLRTHEVVISGGSFWFRSTSKYDELILETMPVTLAMLEDALRGTDQDVLVANDVDALRTSIIECGDMDFSGAATQ